MKREKLIRARIKKGLSQKVAAELMGVSRNVWSLWEQGKEDPYPVNVGALCKFFGVKEPSDLDLEPPQLKTEKAKERTTTHPELLPTSFDRASDEAYSSPERQKHIHTLETGIDLMKKTRRHLLQHMLNLAEGMVATHAVSASTPLEQFAEILASPAKIDDVTLAHLEMITKNHWYLFLRSPSKSDLLSSCWGHLQTLLQFLKYSQTGAVRNRLYSLAGESAVTIGEILFDIQDYHHAQIYYQFAINAAKEAGNNPLRAVGLGRLSFLPIYRDEPQLAYPFLQEAKQVLTYSPRPKISSWLAAVEAETMAHLGDTVACEEALEQAETLYPQEGSEEDMLWTQLNNATILGYKGACYLRLRQGQKAFAALKETLPCVPDYSPRHQSLILTDMAAATAQMNKIEESCKFFYEALQITRQTKSLMVLMRMQNVRKHLASWNDTSSVKALDQSIEAFLPDIIS